MRAGLVGVDDFGVQVKVFGIDEVAAIKIQGGNIP